MFSQSHNLVFCTASVICWARTVHHFLIGGPLAQSDFIPRGHLLAPTFCGSLWSSTHSEYDSCSYCAFPLWAGYIQTLSPLTVLLWHGDKQHMSYMDTFKWYSHTIKLTQYIFSCSENIRKQEHQAPLASHFHHDIVTPITFLRALLHVPHMVKVTTVRKLFQTACQMLVFGAANHACDFSQHMQRNRWETAKAQVQKDMIRKDTENAYQRGAQNNSAWFCTFF